MGLGGSLARFKAHAIVSNTFGHSPLATPDEAHLLILASSESARLVDAPTTEAKEGYARKAAELLGIKTVTFGGYLDQHLDVLPRLTIIQRIEEWLASYKPECLYTHSACDLNLDHRITFEAVLTATRPMKGECVRELYGFEIASSTEWGFGRLGDFRPNVFVDITKTIETKLMAMACYESEVRAWPHPRSPEALRAIGRRWGTVVGCDYAEVFELVRAIR
ncbi:MAG: PIG-L family deacetylase [Chloroflexi bacterium]|nr:PIG-L family deacetylase [Chloroflexota bacterium]